MYNILRFEKLLIGISIGLAVLSAVSLAVWGLKLGIDFTGGTQMRVSFSEQRPEIESVKSSLQTLELGDVSVQPTEEKEYILKLKPIDNDTRQKVLENLNTAFPGTQETSFESIGPSVGAELKSKAIKAIIIVLVAIVLFITWAFRKTSKGPVPSWVYGMAAIIALAHDIFITTGIFSFLTWWKGIEVDSLFITALLTILGFSVHDTIVVFDRIREHLKTSSSSFREIINESINSTMMRSLNTSLATLLVLLALFIFGGASIQYFVLTLIIGIILGTYSSIFIASPLLLVFQKFLKRS
ncbi:MAG: protein-export membrane protein SecF [Candidatus Kerfeldbacteria bacterium RIFCSPHIGHO2_12_FULL_48_17]|uniref:Protein-export membrane protein SecF n=1 Tax=Candidatus Kerfeldbacteria bacterium RIFCSPHIGHO2_12_FULL_48_17 TaxID=1798542 RepID=A0A1G2AZI6_9BACT|nr:MAG: protein-export membrane protein SecF [Candidatus Kerfeldbacteria bacterium RIFCSPHIGHO2_12_FULL_48_17]